MRVIGSHVSLLSIHWISSNRALHASAQSVSPENHAQMFTFMLELRYLRWPWFLRAGILLLFASHVCFFHCAMEMQVLLWLTKTHSSIRKSTTTTIIAVHSKRICINEYWCHRYHCYKTILITANYCYTATAIAKQLKLLLENKIQPRRGNVCKTHTH